MSSYNILFRSENVENSHGNGHPLLVVLGVRHTAEHEPGHISPGDTATSTSNLTTSFGYLPLLVLICILYMEVLLHSELLLCDCLVGETGRADHRPVNVCHLDNNISLVLVYSISYFIVLALVPPVQATPLSPSYCPVLELS